MALSFLSADGSRQQIELTASIYREAADNRMSVPQYLATRYPTDAEKYGSTFEQFVASAGLFVHNDPANQIRVPSMRDIFEGSAVMNAGVITRESSPDSRIMFPALVLEAMEDKLKVDLTSNVGMFNRLVAIDDSIADSKFEQPIINYSRPESVRARRTAQLAEPNTMMSITVSDSMRKIPTYSLGMEVSKEALAATSLDLVTLALTRQREVELSERIDLYINSFLSGDADVGASGSNPGTAGALAQTTSVSLDPASTGGVLTHLAWVKFLRRNWRKRHIDWVMCDLATAMKIESRQGRPTVQTDDPTSPRITPGAAVANPAWQDVQIFLLEDGVIPTNTALSIDSRYAIRRVRNSAAEYTAVEQFVLRKAEAMRFDFAEIAYRFMDEAWDVLVIS